MLTIIVQEEEESFDEEKSEFFTSVTSSIELVLEHSLVSLSKWESEFAKPFLADEEKSDQEVMAYIGYMILTPDFSPEVLSNLSQENINEINDYINAPKTATWFASDPNGRKTGEVVTSELIYYWMIAFSIPFECQHWHLNRLFTLIRVCNIKNGKPKKQTRAEMMAQRSQLNEERRRRFGTSG